MDHYSNMADGLPEPTSHSAVISLTNHLLSEFNIPAKVWRLEDINAALFVVLYESLFSDKLPGIIRQPMSREDEVHNCQIVIDVLSTDIVRDSLSHIHATNIVAGDITDISNLLDIFSYLLEYVINRIESDVPTDNDETRSLILSEPDVGAPASKTPPITSVASRDREVKSFSKRAASKAENRSLPSTVTNNRMYRGKSTHHKSSTKSAVRENQPVLPSTVELNTNENRKVILHEDFHAMTEGKGSSKNYITRAAERAPSPIKPDDSQSLLGQKTIDSECSIEEWGKTLKATEPRTTSTKIAWEEKQEKEAATKEHPNKEEETKTASDIAVSTAATSVAAASNQQASNAFSSSLPAPVTVPEDESSRPLRSTVGPLPYQSNLTPEKATSERYRSREVPLKGFSSSLDDLRSLVEKTAALTRFALETSPIRARAERDLDVTDPYLDRPRPRIPGEGARLAKELNAARLGSVHTGNKLSTRAEKKVAFAASDDESRTDEDSIRTPLSAVHINRRVPSTKTDDLAHDNVTDSDNLDEDLEFRRRINNKDVRYGDTYFEVSKPERKKKTVASKDKSPSLATHLARNRQPELGAAHMTLKTEDRAMQRKQEILRRMYDEDLDEFSEEVKHMLDKDARKAKDIEEQVKKSCKQGVPKKKTAKKTKGVGIPSSCKKPRISVSGAHKKRTVPVSPPLKLESEEDLLPLLLDEFPHLHLSEHTWHELWRRGLHQIEAVTRAYNTSKRKKSQAQNQLEDAAERHELLGTIMKKQLDHQKRLRDLKDQKQMAVQLRNKSHEKRMQSARARKYYNEYQVRSRGKQLKRRTKEEMVFRDLFKEALDIQKERIKDIRQYASDQRSRQESRRQNEIDSMENYYRDQFDLLSEKLNQERKETEVRDSAQQKMLQQMKREIRKKMESEIKLCQEQLFLDDDDAHWRQVDADRIKQQLHMARYSAKI